MFDRNWIQEYSAQLKSKSNKNSNEFSACTSDTGMMPIKRSDNIPTSEVSEFFDFDEFSLNKRSDKMSTRAEVHVFDLTSLNGSLIADSSLGSEQKDFVCHNCEEAFRTPRVLNCLHVFCEECLNIMEISGGQKGVICCICDQVTNVGAQDASSLPCDYVLMNMMEMNEVIKSHILCTSCKSKENAVARCADCPHFLCSNCNSAHQCMRCFENHHVLSLNEIKESKDKMPLHKPVYCTLHEKKIEYYCITCQETICEDCTDNEHAKPVHMYENLSSYSSKVRPTLKNLVQEIEQKWEESAKENIGLENALSELQNQYDNAEGLINESFQSYKAILEKCRDEALEELGNIHKRQEIKVMDAMQNLEKHVDHMEYVRNFCTRVLEYGSDAELLTLKQPMKNQLESLSGQTNLKPKFTTSLEFITNLDQFQNQTKKAFGYVKDPDVVTPPEKPFTEKLVNGHGSTSDLRLLENISPNILCGSSNSLAISMMNGNTTVSSTVSTQSSPATSSPLSAPSSFDDDHFPTIAPQTPPLEGLTSLGELNLSRLASLAACNGKPSSPTSGLRQLMSTAAAAYLPSTSAAYNGMPSAVCNGKPSSPPLVPVRNVSPNFPLDLLEPSEIPLHLMNNIQALAKLGGVHVPEPAVNGVDIMNGYGNMAGIAPSNIISSFDSGVDTNAVLDLVSGSSNLMMNGHGSTYDSGPSSFFASHCGMENNLMHSMGGGGSSSASTASMGHHSGYHSYTRNNSQRATALEIHFKFGQLGSSASQFGAPHGFCINADDSIIVADTNNHRIQIFNKDGEYQLVFGVAGKLEGQLWYPRKIEILPSGNFVICDRGNERSRLQLFSRDGTFIKKIRLKYVDIVAGMTVAEDGDIVIVDSVQPSLYKLDEAGSLSSWFDCKGVMTEPSDIAVRNSKFYICDFKGHCVAVFSQDGQFLNRIGNQGLTDYPNGIDVLPNGNILVGDSHGNKFHICIFSPEGALLCEYECPYVKVSRCCGLKITSEGCIITVAKNNHHVLVLKSPF